MGGFSEQLAILSAHCQVALNQSAPLILGLFMVGLVGSASHCAGMCGPFVLAQVGARDLASRPAGEGPGLRRLAGLALLPYHLGRASTYVALGMILAAPIGALADLPGLRWIPAAMLAAAAALFLGQALRSWGLIGSPLTGTMGTGFAGLTRALFQRPAGWRGYALGVVLGFLPCGLLYSALSAAAATADPVAAGIGMLGFVIGTMPMLIAVGLLGHGATGHWRSLAGKALPLIASVNAAVLLIMAWRVSGLA